MDLSRDDLVCINSALNEVLNGPEAIEEWEFQTRMGAHREAVLALFRRVSDELRDPRELAPSGEDVAGGTDT